jgi:hypothetical protein
VTTQAHDELFAVGEPLMLVIKGRVGALIQRSGYLPKAAWVLGIGWGPLPLLFALEHVLSRDAALSFAEPIATGEYTLDAEQSSVVLRVPREKLLTDDGSVKPEAEPLLKNVVRLMQLHKQAKLRVEDSAHEGDAIAVSRLVAALTERAVVSERFEPLAIKAEAAAGAAPSPSPVPPEVSFAFSVP